MSRPSKPFSSAEIRSAFAKQKEVEYSIKSLEPKDLVITQNGSRFTTSFAYDVEIPVVEPVFLRDLCELDYADIAELLDVPVGTVKSRIHDGRAQLRQALYGNPDGGGRAHASHKRVEDRDA